jgi:hypothetical protein
MSESMRSPQSLTHLPHMWDLLLSQHRLDLGVSQFLKNDRLDQNMADLMTDFS